MSAGYRQLDAAGNKKLKSGGATLLVDAGEACCCEGCVLPATSDTLTMTIAGSAVCEGCLGAGTFGAGGTRFTVEAFPDVNGSYGVAHLIDSGDSRIFETTVIEGVGFSARAHGHTECADEGSLQESFDFSIRVVFSISTGCITMIRAFFVPDPISFGSLSIAAFWRDAFPEMQLGQFYPDSVTCGNIYGTGSGKATSDAIQAKVDVDP